MTPIQCSTAETQQQIDDTCATRAALEGVLASRGFEAVVVALPGREISRTAGATALIERWFASEERGRGLPLCLVEHLREAIGASCAPPGEWVRARASTSLRVSFVSVRGCGAAWAFVLHEVPTAAELPASWLQKGLTPREVEVVARTLRGWDNRLIAEDLDCTLATVKKHLQRIFQKLGMHSRAALLHAAAPHA
jgi:DNA-binding NarL/FixJ family response regulator